MKNRRCEFWRRCKLLRECEGCKIPEKAREDEYAMHLKMTYIKDTDYRGITERKKALGPIVKPFEREPSNGEEE